VVEKVSFRIDFRNIIKCSWNQTISFDVQVLAAFHIFNGVVLRTSDNAYFLENMELLVKGLEVPMGK